MDYKDYVKELSEKCIVYLSEVELTGNETAYTDSLLEDIFTSVARLKDFYDKSVIGVASEEQKVVRTLEELKAYLDQKEWSVYEDEEGWDIRKSSPAGEDFGFFIRHNNDVETAVQEIKDYAYNFDEDEHVEMWVEARGNVSGVPDVKSLVEDAAAIQEMLDDLADNVNWCEQKTIGEMIAEATERSAETEYGDVVEREVGLD